MKRILWIVIGAVLLAGVGVYCSGDEAVFEIVTAPQTTTATIVTSPVVQGYVEYVDVGFQHAAGATCGVQVATQTSEYWQVREILFTDTAVTASSRNRLRVPVANTAGTLTNQIERMFLTQPLVCLVSNASTSNLDVRVVVVFDRED